jgi:hypothetical protein
MFGVNPVETVNSTAIPTLFNVEALHLINYNVVAGDGQYVETDLCPLFTEISMQYLNALWTITSRPELYCT